LNFAPAVLSVPAGVDVRKVDLSIELQILAYHEQRKALALGDGAAIDGMEPVDVGSVGTDGRRKAVGA
jgi:redox-sensing transcriptional repressor